jgi:hypothetical protein
MATILTSIPRLAGFLLSEANGQRSRENIVVTQTGALIKSGTVLTQAVDGKYTPYVAGGAAGSADAVLYQYLPAKTGDTRAVGFVRDCEVVRDALTGLDTPAVAQLASKGVIVRE